MIMATSRAAYAAEKAIGHDEEFLTQDVSSFGSSNGSDNELMSALCWQGKNKVEMGTSSILSQYKLV
jgi:hypothetical protein